MEVAKGVRKSAVQSVKEKSVTEKRSTHLFLQEKYLKSIPKYAKARDIQVLYLYTNNIINIDNLNGFHNLTSLYLQSNEISKIENLQNLKKLKKIFLGHNRISVVEGLSALENLEELHIEKQDLPDGVSLCFDPRTLISISHTLHTLNLSHNNVDSLAGLRILKNLTYFDASYNYLDDIREVCDTLQHWYYLRKAQFKGNPFAKLHKYKQEIIANSYCLENLDGKVVTKTTREFIKRFEEEKLVKGSKPHVNIADSIKDLPQNYSAALQKAVSASLLQKSISNNISEDLTSFDERKAVYIPWNALPRNRPFAKIKSSEKSTPSQIKSSIFVASIQKN